MKCVDWMYSTRSRFIGIAAVLWTIVMALTFGADLMEFGVVKSLLFIVLALATGALVGAILWWLFSVFDPKRFR